MGTFTTDELWRTHKFLSGIANHDEVPNAARKIAKDAADRILVNGAQLTSADEMAVLRDLRQINSTPGAPAWCVFQTKLFADMMQFALGPASRTIN